MRPTGRTEDLPVLALLGTTFLARFFLADRNSYWNDEILSIWIYGNSHASLSDAISALIGRSVHPPLYQTVLYGWMQVFGDGETATRSLSNISITLAGLFLYLIVKRPWGRGIALIATLGFSIMYTSMYYALESRSYAQTILLVTVSSWLLLRILDPARTPPRWARLTEITGLVTVNTALMLTHYYDVFWLVAQAAFLGIHLVLARPRTPWWPRILRTLAIALAPQLLFFALWGQILLQQYRDRGADYSTDGTAAQTPLDLLRNGLVHDNLTAPLLVLAALALTIAAATIWHTVRIARTPRNPDHAAWTYLYLATWAALPLLVVYVAFTLLGVERYEPRYFVFVTPPLIPLLTIPLALAATALLNRLTTRHPATPPPTTRRLATLTLITALITALTLPGGYTAATTPKADWRSIAHTVTDIVHNDPNHHYVIVEMTFSGPSRMNYYFARFSNDVRSDVQGRTFDENRGDYDDVFAQLPEPQTGSRVRVILTLNHHAASRFPLLLELLDERYRRVITQLDDAENGIIVFSADPAEWNGADVATDGG